MNQTQIKNLTKDRAFAVAHQHVAQWEGFESDDPNDRGGFTRYGVCEAFLKDIAQTPQGIGFLYEHGIHVNSKSSDAIIRHAMQKINQGIAEKLFHYYFWTSPAIDKLPNMLAIASYDCAVNCGEGNAVRLLQRARNKLGNLEKPLYVDGIIGSKTLDACSALEKQGRLVELAKAAIDLRDERYRIIVQLNPSQNTFLKGWLNRTKSLRKLLELN